MAGLIAARMECEQYPNNLYLVIRKEWVDLRDSTLKDWNDEFGDTLPIVNNNVTFPNGSTIMFRHGDDINALKNANLGGALMVQAEEMSEEDLWFLQGRLRRKEGTRQLRLECNYDGHNWIYNLFNVQKIGELVTTNTFDNQKNLPPDYIQRLLQLPEKLKKRHLYGSDEGMEGRVFDEYLEGKHNVSPFDIPSEWERVIALDHGFVNPTAVLFAAIDYDGKIYIYDEHYEAGKVVSYHAEQIKRRDNTNVRKRVIDPSCAAKTQQRGNELFSIMDEYNLYGIRFDSADNTVLAGINRTNELFKNGQLFIFKNCVNTLREISEYKWRNAKHAVTDRNAPEEPTKKNDHTCDALRYICMTRPKATEIIKEEPFNPNSPWGRMMLEKAAREKKTKYVRH